MIRGKPPSLHYLRKRRALSIVSRTWFHVPDRALRDVGYRAEAKRSHGLSAPSLEQALGVVRPFLDPLLANDFAGGGILTRPWES